MNEYKVTLELDEKINQEIIKATRIEYDDGVVLFYDNANLMAVVFNPI